MIVNATREHIEYVIRNMRDDDYKEVMLTQWDNDIDRLIESCVSVAGVKLAVVNDGIPVCIFGVAPLHPGVGQGWLIGTDDIGRCGVEVAHACRRVIRTLLSKELNRIQAFSADFHSQAHVWLWLVGFKKESTLHKYGKDGSDFYLFVAT